VTLINSLLTGLFDLLFLPLRGLAPVWALIVFSLLAGVLMLWLFGKVSDQQAIRTIRDRIRGQLIAIRLFGDDLGLLFRLQGRLLRDNAVFLRHAFVPILIMLVPVLLILIQLDLRFAHRPLAPGEPAVVKVRLAQGQSTAQRVTLEAPAGVAVETDAVRAPARREVAWRIRAERDGDYALVVRVGDRSVEKDLRVGAGWGAVSTLRSGGSLLQKLLFPGEAPIAPSDGVESISVTYRPLDLRLLGFGVNWVAVFFVLSIVSGFAFRRVLGVEI
jgi:hypothetical protein